MPWGEDRVGLLLMRSQRSLHSRAVRGILVSLARAMNFDTSVQAMGLCSWYDRATFFRNNTSSCESQSHPRERHAFWYWYLTIV